MSSFEAMSYGETDTTGGTEGDFALRTDVWNLSEKLGNFYEMVKTGFSALFGLNEHVSQNTDAILESLNGIVRLLSDSTFSSSSVSVSSSSLSSSSSSAWTCTWVQCPATGTCFCREWKEGSGGGSGGTDTSSVDTTYGHSTAVNDSLSLEQLQIIADLILKASERDSALRMQVDSAFSSIGYGSGWCDNTKGGSMNKGVSLLCGSMGNSEFASYVRNIHSNSSATLGNVQTLVAYQDATNGLISTYGSRVSDSLGVLNAKLLSLLELESSLSTSMHSHLSAIQSQMSGEMSGTRTVVSQQTEKIDSTLRAGNGLLSDLKGYIWGKSDSCSNGNWLSSECQRSLMGLFMDVSASVNPIKDIADVLGLIRDGLGLGDSSETDEGFGGITESDTSGVFVVDTSDVGLTASLDSSESILKGAVSGIDSVFSRFGGYDSVLSSIDSLKARLSRVSDSTERDTLSLEGFAPSASEVRNSSEYSFLFMNESCSDGCFRIDRKIEVGDFLGGQWHVQLDFGNLGGVNLCRFVKSALGVFTVLAVLLLDLKIWRSAFKGGDE